MPFTPIGNGKYRSPSGRTFTQKQVKMYYATNGFTKKKLPGKKQLIKEHTELVKTLRSGSKKELQREAREQSKELQGYKKLKISINNKMKGSLGSSEFRGKKPTGRIQINVKGHKGDKAELASTVKHEIMHVKHPHMTEKKIYKQTAKTKLSPTEQTQLLSKLRMRNLNYKTGAVKRKFKMGSVQTKPGDLITRMNQNKTSNHKDTKSISKTKLSIMGLV